MDIKKTNSNNIYPVILSGGTGSRLWPLSRQKSPKQFIPLFNNQNLLQNTCLRFQGSKLFTSPIIVCNEHHRFQVAESLHELEIVDYEIILEPCARNTAPAIALAALSVLEKDPEGVMLVSPADHYIDDFSEIMNVLTDINVESDSLYALGIKPTTPETGYGYIEQGIQKNKKVYYAKQFVEKPSLLEAEEYLRQNAFYWNTGVFLFKANAYLKELKKQQFKLYELCLQAYSFKKRDLDFIRVSKNAFSKCEDVSIDYAVMEKSENILLIPLNQTIWSDVGSWRALFDIGHKDHHGNIIQGDVYQVNSKNCYFRSHGRLLSAVGVEGIAVIETADAILVTNTNCTQDIKLIVDKLKKAGRQEIAKHKRNYSPWGYSDQLVKGDNFVVNKLYFKIKSKSSLQRHHYRSQCFTVLKGATRVMVNDTEHLLSEGMSITIMPLEKHQVFAIGTLPLEMLEIQSGSYISEDDIERFEESY